MASVAANPVVERTNRLRIRIARRRVTADGVVAGIGGEAAPDRKAGTGIDRGKQRCNVGRIVLTVGVDDHHRVGVVVREPTEGPSELRPPPRD